MVLVSQKGVGKSASTSTLSPNVAIEARMCREMLTMLIVSVRVDLACSMFGPARERHELVPCWTGVEEVFDFQKHLRVSKLPGMLQPPLPQTHSDGLPVDRIHKHAVSIFPVLSMDPRLNITT